MVWCRTSLLGFYLALVALYSVGFILSLSFPKDFYTTLFAEFNANFDLYSPVSCENRLQHQIRRNYSRHPVTRKESAFLEQCDTSGIRVAICHPTLFVTEDGTFRLDRIFGFVSYYRLLGFDHVFLWYEQNILNSTGVSAKQWETLLSLPYVTMSLYTPTGSKEEREYHGQSLVQTMCREERRFAGLYDWTMSVDADEYLYLKKRVNIKEFLLQHYPQYDYLSFGKWMYTQLHVVPVDEDSGFDLDRFGFTAKSYCYNSVALKKNFSYCPGWLGRSKVLAKRNVNPPLHGFETSIQKQYFKTIHFDTSMAHIKEWNSILNNLPLPSLRKRNSSFKVSSNKQVLAHGWPDGYPNENGTLTWTHDTDMEDWNRFVASGCGNLFQI